MLLLKLPLSLSEVGKYNYYQLDSVFSESRGESIHGRTLLGSPRLSRFSLKKGKVWGWVGFDEMWGKAGDMKLSD
jgi:hypothetical protein